MTPSPCCVSSRAKKLDEHCVNAMIDNRDKIEEIQQQFQEISIG